MKKRVFSIALCLCMVLTLLPTVALAVFSSASTGLYNINYVSGDSFIAPTVTGTDNAPILTFKRTSSEGSGGVITSKYTMDFTRSFNIEGSVSFAERDGVSFALHTTADKTSYGASYNTCMLGPGLVNTWNKASTTFTVKDTQNDITNGLLWDFMQYNVTGTNTDVSSTRFWAGAYSYQITGGNTVSALACNESTAGILHSGERNTSGDFKLAWTCTNAAAATGNLTLTMGNTTFTYTDLNTEAVFGGLDKAKAVYFSFSTWLPSTRAGGSGTESIFQTQIAINSAYYTDTGDASGSTLGVETSYYIDTDNDGNFETQLKEATLVGANQTVLARNKIYNRNKNARSPMDMTLLIPNLSRVTEAGEQRISSISNQKFYVHERGASQELLQPDGVALHGNGPLNSVAQLTDYAAVTLPVGGDGADAFQDAYAVYEYRFTPGENVTSLNQTIQLGVAPFAPAVVNSTVYFNSPEAFRPDTADGKIYFGETGSGQNGLYRVVAKDTSSITLFYDGASVVNGGMAQSEASAWLDGTAETNFYDSLTPQEQAALMPYHSDGITSKVILPSENEVKNDGTWGMTNETRATAELGQDSTDWWLRTAGRAVTQNGTDIVSLDTSGTNGIRPVFRVNLANVLFVKDNDVNLASAPFAALGALNADNSSVAPYRLTLVDTDRSFAITEDGSSQNVSPNDTVTLNYTNATTGENCYISALLTDSNGQDLYYGRLLATSGNDNSDGTVSVTVPTEGLSNGTYTLKLFSETIRQDKSTDIGSQFQAVTLNVGNILNGTVFLGGTPEYGCTLTAQVAHSNYLGTLQYQWKRGEVEISGATGSTYTLVQADIGNAITCVVKDSGVESHRDGTIVSSGIEVSKRALSVATASKTITVGQELPEFTLTYSGFVNGDTVGSVFTEMPTAGVADGVDGKTAGTFPITVTANLTTSAAEVYNLTRQNGILTVRTPSSGGSSTPTVAVPVSSDAGKANVSATVSGGTASVSVTDRQLGTVIDASRTTGTVSVDLSGIKGSNAAKLPAKVVKATAESDTATGLQVSLPAGSVKLDSAAVDAVNGGKDVTISVENVKTSALTATQKQTLGDKLDTAVVVDVNVLVNGVKQTNFNGGRVTVSMPYTPKAGEDTSKLTVWYIKDDGSIENVGGYYDAASKCFVFTTTHLSQYVLVSESNPFTDVSENDWFYEEAMNAVNNGWFAGTSDTTFSPNASTTRGMIVTVLHRMDGEPAVTAASAFVDVASGAYYADGVAWAYANGIASGYGNGKFGPQDKITREQLAAILYRYAAYRGCDVTPATTLDAFSDASGVSGYAIAPMRWAVASGLISGKGNGILDPKGNATRAQVAVILTRFDAAFAK